MFLKFIFLVLLLKTFVYSLTNDCSKNWFKNVKILNKEEALASELFKANVLDLKDEKIIAVFDTKVPVLCESSIRNLPSLEILQLSRIGIETLHAHPFKSLPNLKRLFLNGNNISYVPNGVFSGLGVEYLDLSRNQIVAIEQFAFDNMVNLISINLESNKYVMSLFDNNNFTNGFFFRIKKLNTHWFFNCPSLLNVSLKRNELKEIPPYSFKYLEGNDQGKPEIYLEHNKISKMAPKAFAGFKNGAAIFLDDNRLQEIPDDIFTLKKNVMELSLARNRFKCLQDKVLYMFDATCSFVTLEDNPLECDCKNRLQQYSLDRVKVLDFGYENDLEC